MNIESLTNNECIELQRALSNPVLRKYLSILRTNAKEAIVNSVPNGTLEEFYREQRFTQGCIHTLNTLMEVGDIKTN